MKVMRSTREGSTCADCGAEIHIGDPIAYFGPRQVFGLTCHTNPKTVKHLRALQESEAQGSIIGNASANASATWPSPSKTPESPAERPRSTNPVSQHISAQQEWVLRIYTDRLQENNELHHAYAMMLPMFAQLRFAEARDYVELRAPRNVATAMTKTWAEWAAKTFNTDPEHPIAEAAPLWI